METPEESVGRAVLYHLSEAARVATMSERYAGLVDRLWPMIANLAADVEAEIAGRKEAAGA